jgi:uncharacterized protein involved in type VI secretion and phage assembly
MSNTVLALDQERSGRQGTRSGYSIAPGVVTNNLDTLGQGRVVVRIPIIGAEVWARLVGVGAGSDRGFLFVPQIQDEVLVAFNQDDHNDAYVLGGLWNLVQNRIPQTTGAEAIVKRTLKTGLAGGIGHTLEFNDLLQSITISTSTEQKITIDPLKIELQNTAGTLKITMDNTQQKITIAGPQIEIGGGTTLSIKLNATKIEIGSGSTVSTSVKGKVVRIN